MELTVKHSHTCHREKNSNFKMKNLFHSSHDLWASIFVNIAEYRFSILSTRFLDCVAFITKILYCCIVILLESNSTPCIIERSYEQQFISYQSPIQSIQIDKYVEVCNRILTHYSLCKSNLLRSYLVVWKFYKKTYHLLWKCVSFHFARH